MSEENREVKELKTLLYGLFALVIVLLILGVVYRQIAKTKLQTANLHAKVRDLELTAIRAQMNPHFLYNSLNSIQNLVQQMKNDEAHRYLSKFAKLIRAILNHSSKDEITLSEELDILKEYIGIEQLRFDFEYEIETRDVDIYAFYVPPLLLQPIVENAIIHGLAGKKAGAELKIIISNEQNYICMEILDNGAGRDFLTPKPSGNGKGLAFSEERLKLISQKHNTEYQFEIKDLKKSDGSACGTSVKLCLESE
ncbi:sensor histidine kinase [Reichenbachiella versicolor]|uniref:sensor histidine kinase n=1 Tax=Reichenbachiella versicolor TaxID=1821036 RepID=UPI0013A5B821|nr:histidine kinase [Reichenbachiella versicolor]